MDLRCERCQGVLTVSPEGAARGACPHCGHAPAGDEEGNRLDAELGAAFDTMLQPAQEEPAAGEDPAAVEWYVAIEGRQVGPVSFSDLQERWARGVIGPDSLCWRAGLPDWVAIAALPELLQKLPPAPPISRKAEPAAAAPTATEAKAPAAQAREAARVETKPEEPEWNPSAARALESLVEREMEEAEKRQEKEGSDPAIPDPETTGIRVVLRDLPAPPPPEPSKFIPIPKSVPAPAPEPMARPARPAVSAPSEKKGSRTGLYAALVVFLLAGGAAAAYFGGFLPGLGPAAPQPPAAAPVAAAPEAKPAEEIPPAVAEAEPEAKEEPEEEPEAEEGEELAEAEVAEEAEDEAPEADERLAARATAKAPDPARPDRAPTPTRAQASRPARPAAPARRAEPKPPAQPTQPARPSKAQPARSGSRDLLAAGNSSSIDNLFEQEMAAPAPVERKAAPQPYIPPPPGAGVQRPQKLGQGEIMSVVASHRQALRSCASSYKEQGGGSGSVVMSWVIEPDGRTSAVKAAKGAEHAGMVRCLEGEIRGWKFPSYSGPKMEPIEFPFQF